MLESFQPGRGAPIPTGNLLLREGDKWAPRRAQRTIQGAGRRDPIPKFLAHPVKAETRPVQPVPGVWDWRDSGWVPEQGDGSVSRLSQRSGRLLFQGDPWATAFPRILTDIYSPVSHSRPCLNQSDLAKTLKIAPFIPFPRSGYK